MLSKLLQRSLRRGAEKRFYGEFIQRSVGIQAANQFLESLDNNKFIDTPTICVSDPANAQSWEWVAGLDCAPKMSREELSTLATKSADPFQLVQRDISSLSGGIKDLLGSDHPVLEACAKYFFEIDGGKKIRPVMVLAVSYALNGIPLDTITPPLVSSQQQQQQRQQISQTEIKNNKSTEKFFSSPVKAVDAGQSTDGTTLPFATMAQKRLAEITEMIHSASLFHDDVIDKASTRRGAPSVNKVFGDKLAILGGDFLLSRASVALARLRNVEVVELLSTVIEHLVKGEIMQMKPSPNISPLEYYLRKNFYKTASLMGHSCLAAAVLGGRKEEYQRACYLYGTYVGQAFQLIDDAIDFEGTTATIGKAPLADLKSGLATAPTLFAAEEYPRLNELIKRKFEAPGDIDEALNLVQKSQGLQRCRDLAQVHAEKAIESISVLPSSVARDSLIALACKVITRTH